MSRIKITAKRQVTLPVKFCDELGIQAGDELELSTTRIKGKTVWIVSPVAKHSAGWMGSLKQYAPNAKSDHSMKTIRASIANRKCFRSTSTS